MKKIVVLILTFIVLFAVTSCKKATDETGTAASMKFTPESTSAESTTDTVKECYNITSENFEKFFFTNDFSSKAVYNIIEEIDFSDVTEVTLTVPSSVPETQVTTTGSPSCTVRICCELILGNKGRLKSGKEEFLPLNGIILETTKVEISGNETVYDILKKVCSENVCTDSCEYCQKNGIHMESSYTPGYDNYYIEGIHQIYEKDCGSKSGWMYRVNGVFPNTGCSSYSVSDGDEIEWVYTLDLGEDLGGNFG